MTPLRLTLAVALIAVASSGYVVVVAQSDTPSTLEIALARGPQQTPCARRIPASMAPFHLQPRRRDTETAAQRACIPMRD